MKSGIVSNGMYSVCISSVDDRSIYGIYDLLQ